MKETLKLRYSSSVSQQKENITAITYVLQGSGQKERKLYKKRESRQPKIYEPQSDSESEQELAEHEKVLFFPEGRGRRNRIILISF